MIIPILAGLGALCMSNPHRTRRKRRRRNPTQLVHSEFGYNVYEDSEGMYVLRGVLGTGKTVGYARNLKHAQKLIAKDIAKRSGGSITVEQRKNPKRRGKSGKKLWRTVTTVTSSRVTKRMKINPRGKKTLWYEIDKSKPPKDWGIAWRFSASEVPGFEGVPMIEGEVTVKPGVWPAGRLAVPEGWYDSWKKDHKLTKINPPDPRTAATQRLPVIRATRPLPRDYDPRTASTQRLMAVRSAKSNPTLSDEEIVAAVRDRNVNDAIELAYEVRRLFRVNLTIKRAARILAKLDRPNPKGLIGVAADGTRYSVKKNADTREWMVVAYVNGKRHEGRTYYAGDKQDAIDTFNYLMQQRFNPRRRRR